MAFAAKSAKDIQQAAALLAFMQEQRPWEVMTAQEDLLGRGKGWRERYRQGIAILRNAYPDNSWFEYGG